MPEFINPEYQVYTPSGLVDSIDGNTAKRGGMISLANLIPSPETAGLYVCRSAAYALTAFPGFTSPGYVSVMKTIGNLTVGMIATARNAGKDEPFIYNRTTGAFAVISGVTNANTPTSPATTGAWTPPTIAAVGGFFVFTHPGFSGANFIGLITVSGSTYTWSAGNTATNALPSVPTGVTVFFDRAYYTCGNVLYFSDVLAPGTITLGTNTLTAGGNDAILATCGQPFYTTSSGGILAALLAFKGAEIWQVTGDISTNNLALNKLSDGVGTNAPRSIATTPLGTMFVAADGIRTVDLSGKVLEPNPDLKIPFINPITPSRIAAAYNVGFYRICTSYLKGGTLQLVEFWLDTNRLNWCGPHTLQYDCIVPADSTFMVSGPTYTGQALQSNVIPNEQTDFYNELGVNLAWVYQTVIVPEFRPMPGWTLQEASIFLGFQLQQTITAQVLDQAYNILGTVSLTTQFLAPANATNWVLNFAEVAGGGSGVRIPSRHQFALTGAGSANLALGSIFAHYQYQDDNNALEVVAYGGADLDFGSVTDPVLQIVMDWGSVADSILATVDFENTGTHTGPP